MPGPGQGATLRRRTVTPPARIAAAIGILDDVLAGRPAEQALLRWSRASRFAGSGDRAAVRDLVYEALRRRNTLAALGGAQTGRGLMIGYLRETGQQPDAFFTGQGHAPPPLDPAEMQMPASADITHVVDLPDWLLPQWHASLGDDAASIARAMGHRAPLWLRVNPARGQTSAAVDALAADGIAVTPHPDPPTALKVASGERRVAQSAAYRGGLVELQDLSPQLACHALPVQAGDRVLDFCAGGGGKTLAIGGRQSGLDLVAHDADAARMRDLPPRAERAGLSVRLTDDPRGPFDLVVADVPCSGSGTWRRSPDAKWRLTPAALDELIRTQSAILDRVAGLVMAGGHLAYMTCSLLRAESDAQADAFPARHPGFIPVMRRLWTPMQGGDGFFLALFRRTG